MEMLEFERTRATRHACAVPYANEFMAEVFRDRLFQEDIRQLSSAPGTDLEQVLLHTLDARRLHTDRDKRLLIADGVLIPSAILAGSQGMIAGAVVIVLVLIACCLPIVLRDSREVRKILAEMSRPGGSWKREKRAEPGKLKARLDLISSNQFSGASCPLDNVSIHDGFEPFREYGHKVSGWSLVVPMRPQEASLLGPAKPFQEFTAWGLSRHLKRSLEELPGRRSPDEAVLVEDRVFVNGNSARGLHWLWDVEHSRRVSRRCVRPVRRVDDMRDLVDSPHPAARHYLGVHVVSWGGELVTSTFLHLATAHRTLYIDCQRVIMPPVAERYRVLDRMERKPSSDARLWGTALLMTPVRIVMAPALIVGRKASDLAHRWDRKRLEKQADSSSGVDFSIGPNVRKVIGEGLYRSHFQKIDCDRQLKAVERHVLAEVIKFLDEKGMDISEFKSQQTVILNEGIIQSGGTSRTDTMVVGRNSRSHRFTSSPEGK
ncbi:hypothetical protein ABZX85_30905 [Streptomyces sp. NPDC004539]|uniref:hypothetical protein n=1 Tax=Streptomyces sp. NPDC004539 TaxID=3154280 RepID=UPI0033B8E484